MASCFGGGGLHDSLRDPVVSTPSVVWDWRSKVPRSFYNVGLCPPNPLRAGLWQFLGSKRGARVF